MFKCQNFDLEIDLLQPINIHIYIYVYIYIYIYIYIHIYIYEYLWAARGLFLSQNFGI